MADRTQLGRIGYLLGAVTLAVMMIGATVITNHIATANAQDGEITLSASSR